MPRSAEAQREYRQRPGMRERISEYNKRQYAKDRADPTKLARRYASNNNYQKSDKGKERKLDSYRVRKYGLTRTQWEEKFSAQNRQCAICKSATPRGRTGWHTDHNHTTKKVRGILCTSCNTALGLMKDNACAIKEMLAYLTFHQDNNVSGV